MKTANLLAIAFMSLLVFCSGCKEEGCIDPNSLNFNESAEVDDGSCTTSFIDARDGTEYQVVKVGDAWWMAEDLRIGQNIQSGGTCLPSTDNDIIERYSESFYFYDEAMSYNYTEGTRGICPEGWHIPSDQEWKDLELTLGMSLNDVNEFGSNRGSDQSAGLKLISDSFCSNLITGCNSSGMNMMITGFLQYGDDNFCYTNASGIISQYLTSTQVQGDFLFETENIFREIIIEPIFSGESNIGIGRDKRSVFSNSIAMNCRCVRD